MAERNPEVMYKRSRPPGPEAISTKLTIPDRPGYNVELGPGGVAEGQFRGDPSDLISGLEEISGFDEKAREGALIIAASEKEGLSVTEYLDKVEAAGTLMDDPWRTTAPPGARPAEGATISDFSHEERERFRQQVITDQFGGVDPYTIDPNAELEQAEKQFLPGIFNDVFRGQVLWRDRERLNQEQAKHWEEEQKSFRAFFYNKIAGQKKVNKDQLDDMLSRWDKMAKVGREAIKTSERKKAVMTKERIAAEKEARKAPSTINMESTKKPGQITVHKWDKKKQDWVDTGKRAKIIDKDKKVPPKVKTAMDLVKKLAKQVDPMMATILGMSMDRIKDDKIRSRLDEHVFNPAIPKELQDSYQEAIKIIEKYLGVAKTPGPEITDIKDLDTIYHNPETGESGGWKWNGKKWVWKTI